MDGVEEEEEERRAKVTSVSVREEVEVMSGLLLGVYAASESLRVFRVNVPSLENTASVESVRVCCDAFPLSVSDSATVSGDDREDSPRSVMCESAVLFAYSTVSHGRSDHPQVSLSMLVT